MISSIRGLECDEATVEDGDRLSSNEREQHGGSIVRRCDHDGRYPRRDQCAGENRRRAVSNERERFDGSLICLFAMRGGEIAVGASSMRDQRMLTCDSIAPGWRSIIGASPVWGLSLTYGRTDGDAHASVRRRSTMRDYGST